MKGGCGVTPSIIDEIQSWDIQGGRMEGENDATRSMIDELRKSDIQ